MVRISHVRELPEGMIFARFATAAELGCEPADSVPEGLFLEGGVIRVHRVGPDGAEPSRQTKAAAREWGSRHLRCIVADCPSPVLEVHFRTQRDPGFQHAHRGAHGHARMSELHGRLQQRLIAWVNDTHGPWLTARLEVATAEGERRADVGVYHCDDPEVMRVALEVQCADLTPDAWRMRHESYASAGIRDIWILAGEQYKPLRDGASVELQGIARVILEADAQLVWADDATRSFVTPYGRGDGFGPTRVSVDAVHCGVVSAPFDVCTLRETRIETPRELELDAAHQRRSNAEAVWLNSALRQKILEANCGVSPSVISTPGTGSIGGVPEQWRSALYAHVVLDTLPGVWLGFYDALDLAERESGVETPHRRTKRGKDATLGELRRYLFALESEGLIDVRRLGDGRIDAVSARRRPTLDEVEVEVEVAQPAEDELWVYTWPGQDLSPQGSSGGAIAIPQDESSPEPGDPEEPAPPRGGTPSGEAVYRGPATPPNRSSPVGEDVPEVLVFQPSALWAASSDRPAWGREQPRRAERSGGLWSRVKAWMTGA